MDEETMAGFEALNATMESGTVTYRELVALTEREQDALRERDVAVLAGITRDKEALLQTLDRWNATREEVLGKVSDAFQLPVDAPLSDVAACFEPSQAEQILAHRQRLLMLGEQLETLTQQNQLLMQSELRLTEATLHYIASNTVLYETSYSPSTPNAVARNAKAGHVLQWQG